MPSQSKANIETSEEDLSKYDWNGNALNRCPWLRRFSIKVATGMSLKVGIVSGEPGFATE
eukprot:4601866-Prymnesium_polylepis.1